MERYTIYKPLRLSLLTIGLGLAALTAQAATIDVTTMADEDGENAAACSLREAVKAAANKQSYGGCAAGQRYYVDTIQLAQGTYVLTRPIVIEGDVLISGYSLDDRSRYDWFTNQLQRRLMNTTTIQAPANDRMFDSSASRRSLNLTQVNLQGGNAGPQAADGLGGMMRIGGPLTLERVRVQGARASQSGGAIFLGGAVATLNATDTEFVNNSAPNGAVVGMSCLDDLLLPARALNFTRVSIHDNQGSQSILDFCGTPTASFTGTTLARNSLQSQGSVIRITNSPNETRVGSGSRVNLDGVTLTENSGIGIQYSAPASVKVNNSFLAFNRLDCQRNDNNNGMLISNSAINFDQAVCATGTSENDYLQLNNLNVNGLTRSQLLYEFGDYGMRSGATDIAGISLPGYLPRPNISKPSLIDQGSTSGNCGEEQRGLKRSSRYDTMIISSSIRCDIGAMEYALLTAEYVNGANISYLNLIKPTNYTNLNAEERAKLAIYQQNQINVLEARNRADVARIQSKNPDGSLAVYGYRMVLANILEAGVPQEKVEGSGVSDFLPFFDANNYDVETESWGSAPARNDGSPQLERGTNVEQIQCRWDPVLQRILMWRTDGAVTKSGEYDRCRYTIIDRRTGVPVPRSSNIVQSIISNIAPNATDDRYDRTYGTLPDIVMDLLANDNDDGDGPVGSINYPKDALQYDASGNVVKDASGNPTYGNRAPFYRDSQGRPLNIRIVTQPTEGVLVAEFTGPCPNNQRNKTENTCIGGKIVYKPKNNYSPFNDRFTYVVLDSDLTESNEATVSVINTATTTEDGRSQGKGGAFGWLSIAALAGLAGLRRWYKA